MTSKQLRIKNCSSRETKRTYEEYFDSPHANVQKKDGLPTSIKFVPNVRTTATDIVGVVNKYAQQFTVRHLKTILKTILKDGHTDYDKFLKIIEPEEAASLSQSGKSVRHFDEEKRLIVRGLNSTSQMHFTLIADANLQTELVTAAFPVPREKQR